MEFKRGVEYDAALPRDVVDHLRSRKLVTAVAEPDRLHVSADGSGLSLRIANGRIREHPVRASFVYKLLRWFSFPARQVPLLSEETLASILNDYLLRIRSSEVAVTIEDGDALTILSGKYAPLSDLDVIARCADIGVAKISRDDFQMRVYSHILVKTEPVVGDECGLGFNVFNSETGFRALSMCSYVLRYVCSNGMVVGVPGEDSKPMAHYGVTAEAMRAYLDERLEAVTASWEKLGEALKRSVSAPLGEGTGEFLVRRARPALGATAARRLSDALARSGISVYEAANELTSAARELGVSPRLQLETLAGEVLVQATGPG